MIRVLLFLVLVTALALGSAFFVDHPGTVTLTWFNYEVETSVVVALLALAAMLLVVALLWTGLRYLVTRPAAVSRYVHRRQEERGLDALSRGLIAIGAGDREQARKAASVAQRRLPDEPLTALLRAQTAQLAGDRAEARRIFETMARRPATELLGWRGLFLEARREGELEAARQFAERAVERDPRLAWSVNALFELQARAGDWAGALATLDIARRHKHVDRETADRRRAVLLTAQAREAEEADIDRARELALEASKLAPGLVPAAELAARLLVNQAKTARAARLVSRAWALSPHPDLALAYAHLRPGDSPKDRLKRVKLLAQATPESPEGPIAVATAAIEAREWEEARAALQPLVADRPSARVCTLMARIEGEQGDRGRVREWLARALRGPRDPAWTADGFVSEAWLPVSPITGELDAFAWKVPVELLGPGAAVMDEELLAGEIAPMIAEAPVEASASEKAPQAGAADAALDSVPLAPAPETGTKDDVAAVGAIALEERNARPYLAAGADTRPGDDEPWPEAPAAAAAANRPEAIEPVAEEAGRSPNGPETPREPTIFVSPRPPDDPGPNAPADDESAEPEPARQAEKR